MFEVRPLGKPAQHWAIIIDGEARPEIRHIELASQWGTLTWGKRPEGFEGWAFKEAGGAITIPWARVDGQILVGMIAEQRPNMGQEASWCAIGGILDPGETHHQAAARETREESGITNTAAPLPGLPLVSDRLYFAADPTKGEGVRAYHIPFSSEDLEPAADGGWQLKKNLIKLKGESVLRFFPWKKAARMTADSLMAAAILRLMSEVADD